MRVGSYSKYYNPGDSVNKIQHSDSNNLQVAVMSDTGDSDDDVEPVPSTSQQQQPSQTSSCDVAKNASVTEWAANVIAIGHIALETKLVWFTVNSKLKLRVVKLFLPRKSTLLSPDGSQDCHWFYRGATTMSAAESNSVVPQHS